MIFIALYCNVLCFILEYMYNVCKTILWNAIHNYNYEEERSSILRQQTSLLPLANGRSLLTTDCLLAFFRLYMYLKTSLEYPKAPSGE